MVGVIQRGRQSPCPTAGGQVGGDILGSSNWEEPTPCPTIILQALPLPSVQGVGQLFQERSITYLEGIWKFLCDQLLQLTLVEGVIIPQPNGVMVEDVDDSLQVVFQLRHLPNFAFTFKETREVLSRGSSSPTPQHFHSLLSFRIKGLDKG